MCRWFQRQRCSDCSALIDGDDFQMHPIKGKPIKLCAQCWLGLQDLHYGSDLIRRSWELSHD